jgi:prepilin-type processing-associated H-X9-DG protein
VTAILYLLVREQGVEPAAFVCPGTRNTMPFDFGGPAKTAKDWSNFPSERYLSYSVYNAYPAAGSPVKESLWANRLKADFAIAADMNPGVSKLLTVRPTSSAPDFTATNSRNHPRLGQNVLYGDGHVDIAQTVFAGYNWDNIYTYSSPVPSSVNWMPPLQIGITGSPLHENDSVLRPVATTDPGTAEPGRWRRYVLYGEPGRDAAKVGLCVLVVWGVAKAFRARKQRS